MHDTAVTNYLGSGRKRDSQHGQGPTAVENGSGRSLKLLADTLSQARSSVHHNRGTVLRGCCCVRHRDWPTDNELLVDQGTETKVHQGQAEQYGLLPADHPLMWGYFAATLVRSPMSSLYLPDQLRRPRPLSSGILATGGEFTIKGMAAVLVGGSLLPIV